MPSKKRASNQNACGPSSKRRRPSGDSIDNFDVFSAVDVSELGEEKGNVGIIERVTLKNFMCHSNLDFSFSQQRAHVHFIIGRNGSGKSAVLNGIILALGGKSSITGRNSNIKGFIQTGKQAAEVSVTLSNTGRDAYRREDFGPRITISRKISSDGLSTYKIKGDGGKLVSVKKEQLTEILTALNIQIDNPVSILTQEASRCFLESRDPVKKYAFFLKATQLENLWDQYRAAEDVRQDSMVQLQTKKAALPELAKEVKRVEDQLRKLESLNDQKARINHLENEFAWSTVRKEEETVAHYVSVKDKVKKQVDKITASLELYESKYFNCLMKTDELKQQVTACNSDACSLRQETNDLVTIFDGLERRIKLDKLKVAKLNKEIAESNTEIESLKSSVEELRARSQQDLRKEKLRHEAEKELLLKANSDLKENLTSFEKYDGEICENIDICKQKIASAKEEIISLRYKVDFKRKELDTMISSRTNQEFLFGERMPELRNKINAAAERNLFRCKPIGPIGLYIRVIKQKWDFAVEKCLGPNLLYSFCCDNMDDRSTLHNIMKEVYRSEKIPSIIVSKFLPKVHNVQPNKAVSTKYATVFDTIASDIPVVMNCLIDQRSVENILLIEESSEASAVMMDSPPKNCSCAYTLIGDQLYPSPKYRYYSCPFKPAVRFLKQSYTEEDISAKRREKDSCIDESQKRSDEIAVLSANLLKFESELKESKKKINYVKKTMVLNEQKISDLSVNEKPMDLSAQEEDLDQRKKCRDKFLAESEALKQEVREKIQKCTEVKTMHVEKNRLLGTKKTEEDGVWQKLQAAETEEKKLQTEKSRFESALAAEKAKLKDAEKAVCNASNKADVVRKVALKLCPRIKTTEQPEHIRNEISELKKAISERIGGLDKEVVRQNYIEKKTKYDSVERDIKNSERNISRLLETINKRKLKYDHMLAFITSRVLMVFSMNMTAKKFTGSLRFDHAKGALFIEAKPIATHLTTLQNPNTLSGGERSFVTVAFLLALYDVAEMPFHILDEYDVFMDSMNRNVSMSVMMEKAQEQKDNQFIFLSPLDLPKSINPSIAQVHKMPDPERNSAGNSVEPENEEQ